MDVIVVGAGKVGFTVSEVLAPHNNVMVIENDDKVAEKIKNMLDVMVYNDDGINPRVIKDAISRHGAEVVIATTANDENNLFICMMAKRYNPEIKTIARIKNHDFMDIDEVNGVDQIFSPEALIGDQIATLATLHNAVEYEPLDAMKMGLATFLVSSGHTEIIGKVVIGLDLPDETYVVAIYRGNDIILDSETTELHVGDRICVLGTEQGISDFNRMMGILRETNEIVILGATITGIHTAMKLQSKKHYVKIIEPDSSTCKKLARQFSNTSIINGNPVDPHMLKMEAVGRADVLIALNSTDEKNILASLMGKKMGAGKIISEYSMPEYEDIFGFTGIDSIIGYHKVVANEITKTLVSDEDAILKMKYDGELFFSINVKENSDITGERVGDVKLPPGCRTVCIIRGDEKVFPRIDTQYLPNDKVLMFTYNAKLSKLEKMFRTELHYDL